MKNKFLKDSLLSIIIVSFLFFSTVSAILPKKAEAVFGVGDVVTDPAHTTVTITNWAKNFTEKALDFSRKMAYVLLKRVVLDRMVDALIQWINRGGQGGIIGNWDQFLQESADAAVGEFAQGLGAGFLCSNFGLNVQFTLLPVEKFNKVTCTLNQIIGNINNFTENFRNGSWLAYQETWHPRNNFYGATLIAIDEARSAEAKAKEAAQNKGLAGKGFLSFEKCELIADSRGNLDAKGNPIRPGYAGIKYVKDCRVTTPGTVAAEAAVASVVTTPITRIIHADDLTVYLNAIVDAAINQLTKEGIKWMRDRATAGTPPRVNPAFPCAGLTGDNFRACINSASAEKSYFQAVQNITRDATVSSLETRTKIASILTQAINLQTSYVEALDRLISSGKGAGREPELANEQAILDVLNDRFESNQVILEALTSQSNGISGIELSNSVTAEDWAKLGASANTQFIGDFADAESELSAAQDELKIIQDKVTATGGQ
ncbi:MAG: hypothetical protein HYY86_01560 [Candidatus Harrisonbacteria bacterium]|nr:hypothetical protein [Candidatus Harrisonbacteria bacterium]